jgi:hypothetical protein
MPPYVGGGTAVGDSDGTACLSLTGDAGEMETGQVETLIALGGPDEQVTVEENGQGAYARYNFYPGEHITWLVGVSGVGDKKKDEQGTAPKRATIATQDVPARVSKRKKTSTAVRISCEHIVSASSHIMIPFYHSEAPIGLPRYMRRPR